MACSIAVVIPTLDEAGTITNCLDRVIDQLKPRDDVIVVDGGSEDGTIEECRSFGRVTVLEAPEQSLGKAREIGAKAAETDVVVSTDADALPPDGWIDRIRDHFESDPELTVLWGGVADAKGVPVRDLTGKLSTPGGGASGNNTAFRREAFEALDRAYPDVNFMEDAVIINRLSRAGKAVRDPELMMTMDMDRRRYQTIPMIVGGAALVGIGHVAGRAGIVGTAASRAIQGSGVGLAGTELVYERGTGTGFHHDQAGIVIAGAGLLAGGPAGAAVAGGGLGMAAHHALTEGVSAFPTTLMKETDEVCWIDRSSGPLETDVVCVPKETTSERAAKVLAAGAVSSVLTAALLA